jgi:hypothetical protein
LLPHSPILHTHHRSSPHQPRDMAAQDVRLASIKPRLKYNTIGGVNGPLVILDNVRWSCAMAPAKCTVLSLILYYLRSNSPGTTRLSV